MASIATTTLEDLEPLLVAKIEALNPVPQYQRASRWKHYVASKKATGRSRSFTVRWVSGQFADDGYFTTPGGGGVETRATLAVVTDYVGDHEKLQWLVQRDYQHLRDALNTLTAFSVTNGLISVQPSPAGAARVGSSQQARSQLSERAGFDAGAIQINHTFALSYQLARIVA